LKLKGTKTIYIKPKTQIRKMDKKKKKDKNFASSKPRSSWKDPTVIQVQLVITLAKD